MVTRILRKKTVLFTTILLLGLSGVFLIHNIFGQYPPSTVTVSQADSNSTGPRREVTVSGRSNGYLLDSDTSATTPLVQDQIDFAPSLYGTHIDGALRADKHGNLILDIGVRDFFDYFLSAADELGAEAAIDEIIRYADAYLPAQANHQAKEVLGNYLRYKRFEMQLRETPIISKALTDQETLRLLSESFEKLRQERQRLFSTEADNALFGLEDAYANYTLNSMSVRLDDTLDDRQKAIKLNEVSQKLPPQISASQARLVDAKGEQKRIESLIASSSDNAQVYDQLKAEGYAQDRIEQIISYRQQQLDFDRQYLNYASERSRLSDSGLSADEVRQAADKLRVEYFPLHEDQTRARLRDIEVQ